MKTMVNLYVDGDLKQIAQRRGFNLSHLFENALRTATGIELPDIKDKDNKKALEDEANQTRMKLDAIQTEIDKITKEEEKHIIKRIKLDKPIPLR